MRISFEGDIVVFGDVNPGAEISATGDIIVLGSLKGMAHAGAKGDRRAMIMAFDLSPTQLRIADQLAIPPESDPDKRRKVEAELATINDGQMIEVQAFKGRMPPRRG